MIIVAIVKKYLPCLNFNFKISLIFYYKFSDILRKPTSTVTKGKFKVGSFTDWL
jgi:hypothetical protein